MTKTFAHAKVWKYLVQRASGNSIVRCPLRADRTD
jgi:hypothetical protein